MKDLIIIIEGGMVQEIINIPKVGTFIDKTLKIIVRNYDLFGDEFEEDVKTDENNKRYVEEDGY